MGYPTPLPLYEKSATLPAEKIPKGVKSGPNRPESDSKDREKNRAKNGLDRAKSRLNGLAKNS